MESTLKKEHDFYNAHKKEFIEKYLGKVLVIYNDAMCGVFDDKLDALKYATDKKFTPNKFLIKTVTEKEPKRYFCGMWSKE